MVLIRNAQQPRQTPPTMAMEGSPVPYNSSPNGIQYSPIYGNCEQGRVIMPTDSERLLLEPIIKPSFTKAQLNTLRHQILAFKLISKNMPLPLHLQQAILSPIPQDTSYESALPHDPSNAMNINHSSSSNSSNNSNSKYVPDGSIQQHPQQQETAQDFNAYASPYVLLHRSTHTSSNRLRPHHQRFLVPSITPLGIDSYKLTSERERRVEARIRHRMNELKHALDNRDGLPSVQQQQEEDDNHRRAAIELKSLRLLSKQKDVSRKRRKGRKRLVSQTFLFYDDLASGTSDSCRQSIYHFIHLRRQVDFPTNETPNLT